MNTMSGMTWSRAPSRGFLVAGVVQIALGTLFVVLGLTISVLRFFVVLAIFEFFIGFALIMVGRKSQAVFDAAQRLKATGIPGQAVIVGLRQTGITMNEQPQVELQLQVSVPGQEPFAVTRTEYVPIMLVGALTNGHPLPVRVDPNDPGSLAIEWESVLSGSTSTQGTIVGKDVAASPELVSQAGAAGLFPSVSEIEYKRTRLRQFGKDGTAIVQTAQETGQMIGHLKVYVVDLVVTIDGVAKDIAASAAAVSPKDAAKVAAGMLVPLKYDAANPDDLILLWEDARLPS